MERHCRCVPAVEVEVDVAVLERTPRARFPARRSAKGENVVAENMARCYYSWMDIYADPIRSGPEGGLREQVVAKKTGLAFINFQEVINFIEFKSLNPAQFKWRVQFAAGVAGSR